MHMTECTEQFAFAHVQSVDSHARPLFNLDGTVAGSWGAFLVGGGNTDGCCQTPGEDAIIPWVHCDDDGECYTHGFAFENEA